MPRYILTTEAHHPQHERFVKKLAREFNASTGNLQPLILEEHLPGTKSRHVNVIWNDWRDLPLEERSDIIREAYAQAEGDDAAANVMIASGLTPTEALALGLLPYKVEPARRRQEAASAESYRHAFVKEATNSLLGAKARELRYARLEDAEEARRRLEQSLPASSWMVVKEEATAS